VSAGATQDRPLIVLQSFPEPRPTTNPYIVMLRRCLAGTPGIVLEPFTWRRFVLGRFDVFHVHWLEVHLGGPSRLKNAVRQLLVLIGLVRLRALRRPLVRTMHNLKLPSDISRRERFLLRLAERWTTLRIVINEATPASDQGPVTTILHGHYRDWFTTPPVPVRPGRLAFFGQIRRYKNVDGLLAAFRETTDAGQELSLRVVGRPTSPGLAAELRTAAASDPRVTLDLGFVEDADLVAEITAAELVVLPYREMHNSGSSLTALSLGRPVLVPDNAANRTLAAEVGAGWVLRYPGELTGDALLGGLARLRTSPPAAPPDLHRRNWDCSGNAHLAAYRRAVSIARGAPETDDGDPVSAGS
jgi:glycosyltransferase involved in cell wall biosynthesis